MFEHPGAVPYYFQFSLVLNMKVALRGIIGVGKTTFTAKAGALGWPVSYEPVEENPYLGAFYAGDNTVVFPMEIFLALARQRQFRAIHEEGRFHSDDYHDYLHLYGRLFQDVPKLDVVIWLKVSPETALGRIRARGRESEMQVSDEDWLVYLTRLNEAYESQHLDDNVMVVDWEQPGDVEDVLRSARTNTTALSTGTSPRLSQLWLPRVCRMVSPSAISFLSIFSCVLLEWRQKIRALRVAKNNLVAILPHNQNRVLGRGPFALYGGLNQVGGDEAPGPKSGQGLAVVPRQLRFNVEPRVGVAVLVHPVVKGNLEECGTVRTGLDHLLQLHQLVQGLLVPGRLLFQPFQQCSQPFVLPGLESDWGKKVPGRQRGWFGGGGPGLGWGGSPGLEGFLELLDLILKASPEGLQLGLQLGFAGGHQPQ